MQVKRMVSLFRTGEAEKDDGLSLREVCMVEKIELLKIGDIIAKEKLKSDLDKIPNCKKTA